MLSVVSQVLLQVLAVVEGDAAASGAAACVAVASAATADSSVGVARALLLHHCC